MGLFGTIVRVRVLAGVRLAVLARMNERFLNVIMNTCMHVCVYICVYTYKKGHII